MPAASLDDELMAYAHRVAANDPFQIRMMKAAINNAQDVQGFSAYIPAGYAFHMLSSIGEKDESANPPKRRDRRRPQVHLALENQKQAN